jgi:lipoprotein signal peptidase
LFGFHFNTGCFFGLPLPRVFLIIISTIILIYLIKKNSFNGFYHSVLIASVFSNLFDRALKGAVVDYIYISINYIDYIVWFNLSDIVIFVFVWTGFFELEKT